MLQRLLELEAIGWVFDIIIKTVSIQRTIDNDEYKLKFRRRRRLKE